MFDKEIYFDLEHMSPLSTPLSSFIAYSLWSLCRPQHLSTHTHFTSF